MRLQNTAILQVALLKQKLCSVFYIILSCQESSVSIVFYNMENNVRSVLFSRIVFIKTEKEPLNSQIVDSFVTILTDSCIY